MANPETDLRTAMEEMRPFIEEDNRLDEIATDLVREFHRLLNTTSGVMAAGIVLSGGNPADLTFHMKLALLCFVLSLLAGLSFLHFVYLSHQGHRTKRAGVLAARLDRMDLEQSHQELSSDELAEYLEEDLGLKTVPMSLATKAARLVQIGLVATGFGLVLWSLWSNLF